MIDNKIFLQVVELALNNDKPKLVNLLHKIAVTEASKKRSSLYNQLLNLLNSYSSAEPSIATSGYNLVEDNKSLNYLPPKVWLSESNEAKIQQFIKLSQVKSSHIVSLQHINKLLLYGPPGTGKTTLGFYIAHALKKQLLYVKVSDVISSRFGETMKNFSDIFKHAKEEIIFIDEFDAFAKNRTDNVNDVGELKRIVNSMIQTLDFQSDNKIVIVATNLVESIDPAILRRFAFKIYIGGLDKEDLGDFVNFTIKENKNYKITLSTGEKNLLLELFEYLKLQTIDQITLFFQKTLMNAYFEKNNKVEFDNFIESLFYEDYFNKESIKLLKKNNQELLNKIGKLLKEKGLTQAQIAKLMGIHRNSYHTYVEEI